MRGGNIFYVTGNGDMRGGSDDIVIWYDGVYGIYAPYVRPNSDSERNGRDDVSGDDENRILADQ